MSRLWGLLVLSAISSWSTMARADPAGDKQLGDPEKDFNRQTRLRVDLSANWLYRERASGPARLFESSPRHGGWLRGGLWFGKEVRECQTFSARSGVWFGHRYEPVIKHSQLASSDFATNGVETWMLAHDLSLGAATELALWRGCAASLWLRLHVAPGLSLTTLRLHSLDDGHVHSQTTPALNMTGTVEVGGRFWNFLDAFVGFGSLYLKTDARLRLVQTGADFPSSSPAIDRVSRSGLLFFTGAGIEF
jgi:hypothetical protein